MNVKFIKGLTFQLCNKGFSGNHIRQTITLHYDLQIQRLLPQRPKHTGPSPVIQVNITQTWIDNGCTYGSHACMCTCTHVIYGRKTRTSRIHLSTYLISPRSLSW